MAADRRRLEVEALEAEHRAGDALERLRREEHAGAVGEDGLDEPAARVADDRAACGHRLHGGDAEVLLGGDDQRAAAGEERGQLAVGDAAEEVDVVARRAALEARPCRPVPGDEQRNAEVVAGLDREVDALVVRQARRAEVEVVRLAELEATRVHGRVHDGRRASVCGEDPPPRRLGVRDVAIGAPRGPPVPAPQRREQRARDGALAGQVRLGAVEPPRRVVAVHDVQRVEVGADAVRPAARARHDDVVAAQIERGERPRVRGKAELRMPGEPRDILQEARAHVHRAEGVRHGVRVVDRREDRRVGPEIVEDLDDALRAAVLHEVVVGDRDLHAASLS